MGVCNFKSKAVVFNISIFLLCISLNSVFSASSVKNDGDEGRPYEFGFTIDGQQHRHESRDVNGIVQGEFGFITADGVYHTTVYATDENGAFKILSMRSVKISEPLDQLPGGKAPSSTALSTPKPLGISSSSASSTQKPVVQLISSTTAKAPYEFTTKPTIKPACGGCGVPQPSTKKPEGLDFQNPHFKQPQGPASTQFGPSGGVNYLSNTPNQVQTISTGNFGPSKPDTNNQNSILSNAGQSEHPNNLNQNIHSSGNAGFKPSSGVSGFNPSLNAPSSGGNNGLLNTPLSTPSSGGHNAASLASSDGNNGLLNTPSLPSSGGYNHNVNIPSLVPSGGNNPSLNGPSSGGINGPLSTPSFGGHNAASLPSSGGNNGPLTSSGGYNPSLNAPSSGAGNNGPSFPSSSGINLPSNAASSGGNIGPSLPSSGGHNAPSSGGNNAVSLPSSGGYNPSLNAPSSGGGNNGPLPSSGGPAPSSGGNNAVSLPSSGGYNPPSNAPSSGYGNNAPSLPSSGGHNAPSGEVNPIGGVNYLSANNNNNANDNLNGITIANGMINIPNNPSIPIVDKFPGMMDGLPNGIEEKNVLDLLYKFNYTVGFHGHYEKGLKNGAKIGGYFVNGRDGISRVVTYIADENGYRPKFKLVNLGLDSPDTPKEDTEKTFGLKSFEFIWYPIK